ncbi:MAG: ATP-binding protein [Rhodobacteraceae bacterium]|nr:ATP-binding protein [Paracoccaceae bacterium]
MTDPRLTLALRNASLCGPFDPLALLVASGIDPATPAGDTLAGALSLHVEETLLHDRGGAPILRWTLKPDSRRAALADLVNGHLTGAALRNAPAPAPKDRLAPVLRAILSGTAPGEPARAPAEPRALHLVRCLAHWGTVHDAAQFAAAAPSMDKDRLQTLRGEAADRIRRLQRARDIETVLPHLPSAGGEAPRPIPLFGRDHYRRRLTGHLEGRGDDPRPVLLTGIGGAGKSALLAAILQGWQTDPKAPIMLLLDFDRRQLAPGDPVQMLHEVFRQLSAAIGTCPGLTADDRKGLHDFLSALRHDLPALTTTGTARSFDSQMSFIQTAILPRLADPKIAALRQRPIALVLDSFEAVDRQGGGVVTNLLSIERDLRESGLRGLRSVVSGRAEPADEAQLAKFFGPKSRRITLRGIGKVSGGRLLERHDSAGIFTRREDREAASEALGGHPLALMVLGRYASTYDGTGADLLAELKLDKRFRAEFAHVYLYERILLRIANPDVRALAHPGLVLRHLNADLIRLILAEPCFGHAIPPERAAALLADLTGEYWLVEPEPGTYPLRHRADLRRLMLPGLFAEPRRGDRPEEAARKADLATRARAVCDAAAAFYDKGPGKDDPAHGWWSALPPREREVEAAYYRALGSEMTPWFREDFAHQLDFVLGEDLETLPPAWIARVRVLRGDALSETDKAALPEDLRVLAVEAASKRMTRQGGVTGSMRARETGADVAGIKVSVSDAAEGPPEINISGITASTARSEIVEAFLGADFDTVVSASSYLDDKDEHELLSNSSLDGIWESPIWYSLLATAALSGAPPPLARKLSPSRAKVGKVFSTIDDGLLDVAGRLLNDLLFPTIDATSAERSPLRNNRMQGRAVVAALTGKTPLPEGKGILLAPGAFSLAAPLVGLTGAATGTGDAALTLPLPRQIVDRTAPIAAKLPPRLSQLQDAYRATQPAFFAGEDLDFLTDYPGPSLLRYFRGLSPELYEPAAAVLRDFPPDKADERIDALIAAAGAAWPYELDLTELGPFRADRALTYVETADQYGLLGVLLGLMADDDPRAATLKRMHDVIGLWFFGLPLPDTPA